ncbi:glycosyltransferase [Polynucleobacter sp. AP-Nickl1-40-C4]|uniref:glycosyltransferase n=1 Tax=Polynucleobacter sp. AP-Nickl1-40-C4 TaxID=3108275 RepID=UPI002B235F3D|nr:glycosyltransferase [Polynucleobacter sp. AP-Nickl1-40-C4]MEA9568016.1 glycosyltransferase [Polynucleobacter sp. AP-Nickl1-40-C4]
MVHKYQLSIIIPALFKNNEYKRCLECIYSALEESISFEVIVVTPNPLSFHLDDKKNLRYIEDSGTGIYAAMNQGIFESNGEYIYFIGIDDILIPLFLKAFIEGVKSNADLILGDVYWGKNKIFKNYYIKYILLWKNWCHQGIIYKKNILLINNIKFDTKYKVQADHHLNILIATMSKIKIYKFNGAIAWYSSTGFSSRFKDQTFRSFFPILVRENFGYISYLIVITRRIILSIFNKFNFND